MRSAILILVLAAACRHPEVISAGAASGSSSSTVAGTTSAAAVDAKAKTVAQSGSSAGVTVQRAPLDLDVSFTPAVDGGQPTFSFHLHGGGESITAGATGTADAGAETQVDAGAVAAADAGASSSADAGAAAKVEPERPPFWTLSRLVTLLVGIAVLLAIVLCALRVLAKKS